MMKRLLITAGFLAFATPVLATCPNPITVKDAAGTTQNMGAVNDASGNCQGEIAVIDGADVTLGAKADAAYAGSGSASVIAALKGLYAVAVTPLANRSGVVAQTSISVTNSSTALLTAAQFTNFEKICVSFTASTGVWVNWAGVAAVAAAPSEYLPPGQCDSWVGSTGFMPTSTAFAISNSASTIAVTVEGN